MVPIHPAQRMARLPKNEFVDLVRSYQALLQSGCDVINLGQGNPDIPTPSYVVQSMQQAIEDPTTHGYSPFSGISELRNAIAKWYSRQFNVEIDPETEVSILPGGKAGLVHICECLLDPGDVCLVPDPGYPDYWSGPVLCGAEMATYPLIAENGYMLDVSDISPAVLKQAKLMFLNYPSNPTAAAPSMSMFQDVVEWAHKNGIIVAHDAAYASIVFDGRKPLSFLQAPGAKEVGIEFYTMSKAFSMAGWRVGFALGNRTIISLLNLIQEHYYVSIFAAVQRAAAAALSSFADKWLRDLVGTYELRRDAFVDALNNIGWEVQKPSGSIYVWARIPSRLNSKEFTQLALQHAHIVMAPGSQFGTLGEGYVRMALVQSKERLLEAAQRLAKIL